MTFKAVLPASRLIAPFGRETAACEHNGSQPQTCVSLPPEKGGRVLVVLLDLELAQDGVPGNINFVPGVLDAAQRAFAHLAQIAERRRIADERVISSLGGRCDLDRRQNQFDFLRDDAFDFEEMVFIRRPEFFGAGDVDEMVELLPAFDVGFDLGEPVG